jgi:hypothetical protein
MIDGKAPLCCPGAQFKAAVTRMDRRDKGLRSALEARSFEERQLGEMLRALKVRMSQTEPIHDPSIVGHGTVGMRDHPMHAP